MIVLRSLIFNIAFYVVLMLFLIFGLPLTLASRITAIRALQAWGRTMNWLLRVICNIKVEVRGAGNIPPGPLLVAGKHQSTWETFALPVLFNDPCVVLKKQIFYIPLMGWPYGYKFRMLPVDRGAGSKALKDLIRRGKEELAAGRQIIILPEGTRRPVGAPPDYKSGTAALYTNLNVPCVTFGLNAGVFWPRHGFLRPPGTIVIEFGKTIPPGLTRKVFEAQLQDTIETISNRLVAEASKS
ncbi:lysophospholipid acyltransferase family protein [Aestuariivirga litoralis]|uniref:lysophospholipid acyltransferase family protein n=1 Tax=Aestuariivirga litoralis TaxID=2650924 RepID=UPI0018C70B8C|nr:lysophospholipid acyltransferase family protein [Aestuariivirga litoralis]MBG1233707.1 1-acyl-sn-glycerol-3-phosphate acyltransferase [Aestuariivirga litoralis]